jgi:hypothetical protein
MRSASKRSGEHTPTTSRHSAAFVTFQKPCEEALRDLSEAYNALADRIEEAWAERDSLMADSWRAFVEAGGDPDGDLKWHCTPAMAGAALVDAVRQLRADYDEALMDP